MKNIYLVLIAAIALITYSCTKKNLGYITKNGAPTEVIITVKDSTNKAVSGKNVVIYHPHPQAREELRTGLTEVTKSGGKAFFDVGELLFDRGQTGVATLFVAVVNSPGDTLEPKNANDKRFDILPEQTNEHTYIMK